MYLLNIDTPKESTNEEEKIILEEVENKPNNTEDEVPRISYNALSGISSP